MSITDHLDVHRVTARTMPGGLRDAVLDFITAIEAGRAGLLPWRDVVDHPSVAPLRDCICATDDATVRNIFATLMAEAWRKREREEGRADVASE